MSPPAIAKTVRAARRIAATAVPLAVVCALTFAAPVRAWEFDISGPTVAFRDGTPGVDTDIWLYNLDTRQYTRATDTPEDAEQSPVIAGQRAYFLRTGPFDALDALDAYDFQSGQLDQDVASFDWIDASGPSGDAGHLVFAASQSTGFSPQAVYVLDAEGSTPEPISPDEPETLITPTTGNCVRTPDIDYPWVVWFDNDRLDCNQLPGWLYARNLETGVTTTVATPFCYCTAGFQVSDGKVAVIETEGESRVLALYDLAADTRTVLIVPDEPTSSLLSDFRGSRIVYSDGGPHIYDLATGQTTPVTTAQDGEAPYPPVGRLSGEWIVYPTEGNAKLVARNLQSSEKRVIRPRPSDQDGDGFGDADDLCPDAPGVAPNGCPASSAQPSPDLPSLSSPLGQANPSRAIQFRAIGDSITAGFGFDDSGQPVSRRTILRFCLKHLTSPRCQSPYKTSYPAFFAEKMADTGVALPDWRNYAETGSTPNDWLSGRLSKTLKEVVSDDPDLTALTLGANPSLTDALWLGPACTFSAPTAIQGAIQLRLCVRAILTSRKVTTQVALVLRRLLKAEDNHVVVLAYHDNTVEPLAHIYVDELNRAVRAAVGQIQRNRSLKDRIIFVPLRAFAGHGCLSSKPWILSTDGCIHPNASGYQQFAAALASGARRFDLF